MTDSSSLFDIKGKIVVVSGGGKGIGAHIARGFVENGAKVTYIVSRDAKSLEARATELNALGKGKCVALPADLSKCVLFWSQNAEADPVCRYEEVERVAEELAKREDRLHVLVNNAGKPSFSILCTDLLTNAS